MIQRRRLKVRCNSPLRLVHSLQRRKPSRTHLVSPTNASRGQCNPFWPCRTDALSIFGAFSVGFEFKVRYSCKMPSVSCYEGFVVLNGYARKHGIFRIHLCSFPDSLSVDNSPFEVELASRGRLGRDFSRLRTFSFSSLALTLSPTPTYSSKIVGVPTRTESEASESSLAF